MTQPIGIDLLTWAGALVIDFPNDNVPNLYDEQDWKAWGNYLVQEPTFEDSGSPGTDDYQNWQDWALGVYYTIND